MYDSSRTRESSLATSEKNDEAHSQRHGIGDIWPLSWIGNVGEGGLEIGAGQQLHLVIKGQHDFIGSQPSCVRRNAGKEKFTGTMVPIEPGPGQAEAHGISRPPRHQAEPGQTCAKVLTYEHRLRGIRTELIKPAHATVVLTGVAGPQPLRAE